MMLLIAVKEIKTKLCQLKYILILPGHFLSDTIDNHKTQWECKVHSSNTIIDYKTQDEWKV